MRIPFWIWIMLGLSVLGMVTPIPYDGSLLLSIAGLAVGGLFLWRMFMRGVYQQQYQQYRHRPGAGSAAGQRAQSTGQGGYASGSAGAGPQGYGSQNFYSRFRNWGAGYQQGAGTTAPPSGKDPYAVLGVSRGASTEEIKKAYREKLKKYHPDVIANLKLGAEYKEMFEDKTREIQHAYEQLGGN